MRENEDPEDDDSSSDEETSPFDEHSIWRAETRHHTNDTNSHYVTRTNLLTDNPSLSNSEWLSGVRPMPDTNDPTPRHGAQPTSDVQADCAPSAVQKDHEFQIPTYQYQDDSEQFQVITSEQFPQFQILAKEPRFQSLESQFEEAIDSQFHNIHAGEPQFQTDIEQFQSQP